MPWSSSIFDPRAANPIALPLAIGGALTGLYHSTPVRRGFTVVELNLEQDDGRKRLSRRRHDGQAHSFSSA